MGINSEDAPVELGREWDGNGVGESKLEGQVREEAERVSLTERVHSKFIQSSSAKRASGQLVPMLRLEVYCFLYASFRLKQM